VRKVFRIGLTDGDYSEILPVREGKEVSLKSEYQVITGIEGGSSASGAKPAGGPRMF
jgi:HlyD family secretion protein